MNRFRPILLLSLLLAGSTAGAQEKVPDTAATQLLPDVVITALGISQESRSIGYSTQQLDGTALREVPQPNILNALAGKVAGLQVTSSAGTPGASAYIKIRGSGSLLGKGDNSIASNGDPLWVIDGVPIDNSQFIYRGSPISDLKDVAFSNRAIDLNPDDIASVEVLKGPAATVLYGSRAAGGALLVTTRRGKAGPLRVTYNGSVSMEVVNKLPRLQNSYSQGYNGQYNSLHRNSWGAPLDSLQYTAAGAIVPLGDSAGTGGTVAPFDNVGTFFQKGFTASNNISLSGGGVAGAFYASIGNLTQQGVVPGSSFGRTNIRLTGNTGTDKFRLSASAAYTHSGGTRFQQGSNESGIMVGLLRTPPSFDDAKAHLNPNGTQRSYSSAYDNPYFSIRENPFTDEVNRLNGWVAATYDPKPWLSALYRVGTDVYSEQRKQVFAVGNRRLPAGQVYDDQHHYREVSSDLLVTLRHALSKNIRGRLLLGAAYNQRRYENLFSQGDGLTIPGYYNLNNATGIISGQYTEAVRTQGLFAQLRLDYKSFLYAEFSGRRDQASTFGPAQNSFFYPGVSGAFVFTEVLPGSRSFLSFGKVRAAWAQAGKEPPAYKTGTNFTSPQLGGGYITPLSFPFGGVAGFVQQTTSGNAALGPEVTSSYEGGMELHSLRRRAELDITVYQALTRDQIIPVRISAASGGSAFYANAGSVENKGVEVIFKLRPIQRKDFNWTVTFNFSRNRNTVLELVEGLEGVTISSNFASIKTRNLAGQPYGAFFGTRWLRDAAGNRIIDDNTSSPTYGLPLMDSVQGIIGNPAPDWMAGLSNEFTFKNWSLGFLADVKKGGDVWNGTRGVLADFGAAAETEDRSRTTVFSGVKQSNGAPNDIVAPLDQRFYQSAGSGFNGPAEQYVEDGSWLRLREVSLRWSLPAAFLSKLHLGDASLGLWGRNLLLLTNYSGIDPETNLKGADPGQGFDYFNMPGTKSYGISVRVGL